VHDAFLEHGDQQTAAVCDLREDYLDLAVKKSRATPKRYKEYRKLLEDKEVDAVVIATPDHWHAIMFLEASPETSPSRSDAAPAIRGLASASQALFARGRCCLSPNCPPATPELSEFLEPWSAPQARCETLSKIVDRLRRPKRCVRVDAEACPRFSSRQVRRSLMGDCHRILRGSGRPARPGLPG
jgi:hypothetical protein